MIKPNVLLIVLPYLLVSQENKCGYWGEKYEKRKSPSTKMNSYPALPYGILSIATYCKDVAKIKIIDCNVDEEYLAAIEYEMWVNKPAIIGIGMQFDNSYRHLKPILELVRKIDPQVVTVMGGAATAAVYEEILEDNEGLDAVCFGEGEIPFKQLCEMGENAFLLPLWITKRFLALGCTPYRNPGADMDSIISLDYSFINPSDYAMREEFSPFSSIHDEQRRFFVVTSKGCPYACNFCYRSRGNDRKMRFASVDAVVAHARELKEKYAMNVLTICDDQFLVNMKRAKEIFRQLIPLDIKVECLQGVTAAFIDREMAELMWQAGMRRVVLPIESGSQEMLDKMVGKPVDLDRAKDTIAMLKEIGFWTTAVFVCGFPGETDKHRKETVDWVMEAGLHWSTFSAAIPIKGTKLWDMCVEGGYVNANIKLGDMDWTNYTINDPHQPADHVAREIYKMNLECNFLYNRSMADGDFYTAEKAFRQVIKMYEEHAFAWYFLAECLKLTDRTDAAREARNRFDVIMMNDEKWREYGKEFGIYV